MNANRIFLIFGNDRWGRALRSHLEENRYTVVIRSADAIEEANLRKNDAIVLDAHFIQPRTSCRAVHQVRAAREHGSGTPFVILTWLPYQNAIVNPQLAGNPFIGHYYRDSCRFVQLPAHPERLVEVLNEIRPCTDEEIKVGMRFLAQIGDAHRPSIA